MNPFEKFVSLLAGLSSESWEATIEEEPEWQWMLPLSQKATFGSFAATFIMLGLNDFQTKGKANVGYWPHVVPLLSPVFPKTPEELKQRLQPFYETERLAALKTTRLCRFCESELCIETWNTTSLRIESEFAKVWGELAYAMKQAKTKKTIAFAMKCLALALLMVDRTKFDFTSIPVPLDSRILGIPARMGIPVGSENEERERWAGALRKIRNFTRSCTMVHLDSLLWQIGAMPQPEMQAHLIGRLHVTGDIAEAISGLFAARHDSNQPTSCGFHG